MKAWMRLLSVSFKNHNSKIVFGENHEKGKTDLSIDVSINKYMSAVKDTATIRISNLSYNEMVQLIMGKYLDVEIKAGYKDTGYKTVFKGGVIHISNSLGDRKTNTVIILCASTLIAKYQQQNINLSFRSGINMYSALTAMCKRVGIRNSNISQQLKKVFIKDPIVGNSTPANFLENILNNSKSIGGNSDSSTQSIFSMYDMKRENSRIFNVTSDMIQLTGGYPQISNNGLTLTTTPTFSFMCADLIKIDNSIIDISSNLDSTKNKMKGYYLDDDGLYIIISMSYHLTNRDSDFSLQMLCRARSYMKNLMGVSSA